MIDTVIKNKSKCTGCGVCANVCEFEAIKMNRDTEGFLYPSVDYSLCKKCKKCISKCPSNQDKKRESFMDCYAIYSKDSVAKQASSSGGCFNLLAKYVLENGGAVCGAAFDENWAVQHIIIDNCDDLYKIQTSKYLQSTVHNTFSEIKKIVLSGRLFLFSGTPCQVNALRTYLGQDYENLILIDIICHGVPSPMVWQKYLKSVAGNDTVTKVNFRDKTNGWATFSMRIDSKNNSYVRIFPDDPYMRLFLDNFILRPSCYDCSNKDVNRFADITIGDFWGIDNCLPELNDDTGISALTVYTEKGRKLFDIIKETAIYKSVKQEKITASNSAFYSSVAKPQNRDKIMMTLSKKSRIDFDKAVKACKKTPFLQKVKRKIKKLLRR
ncbi:MAG: Coenzyme F420 hydrogenase/dehydrogenase, beta subunit C-terminal domain [Clostridia bacterium]|nr:Coenzyme F420 hydrogenase/dehydrogenase, beta subunit C-terminal domain [Clostridia bacterium]